jgi:DNA-binding transcriptional LysR family regulator
MSHVPVRHPAAEMAHGLKGSGVSLQQLRLFVTLAQHRSFTQAGNALGVTQSAASRSIRELEELLDLRLFDRTTRHVALTDTGRALLPRIASLVDELEVALRFGREVATAERGVVSIACSSSIVASVLPTLFALCRASFPNVSLSVHDAPQTSVLDMLRSGGADLGLLIKPCQASDDLVTEPLFSEPLCALVPARHPFASNATIRWRDLSGADLFLLDDAAGSFDLIASALSENGASNVKLQRLTQAASVVQMVAAGLGIGIQPMQDWGSPAHSLIQAIRLSPSVSRTIVVARRANNEANNAHRSQASAIWTHVVSSYHEHHKPLQTADV